MTRRAWGRQAAFAGAMASCCAIPTRSSAQGLVPPPPLAPPPSTPPGAPNYPYGAPAGTYTTGAAPPESADESQDSGLGLEWLWAQAEVGVATASIDSLNSSNLSLQHTSSAGPAVGLAAGARLLFFTAGIRARDFAMSDYSLWEVDGELAFHMRIDRFDPYFGLRGGYAFSGSSPSGSSQAQVTGAANDASVQGGNAGFNFGLDYYFNHFVSVGIDGNPDFLFISRPPVPLPASIPINALTPAQRSLYEQSGSSVGFAFVAALHVGVHY